MARLGHVRILIAAVLAAAAVAAPDTRYTTRRGIRDPEDGAFEVERLPGFDDDLPARHRAGWVWRAAPRPLPTAAALHSAPQPAHGTSKRACCPQLLPLTAELSARRPPHGVGRVPPRRRTPRRPTCRPPHSLAGPRLPTPAPPTRLTQLRHRVTRRGAAALLLPRRLRVGHPRVRPPGRVADGRARLQQHGRIHLRARTLQIPPAGRWAAALRLRGAAERVCTGTGRLKPRGAAARPNGGAARRWGARPLTERGVNRVPPSPAAPSRPRNAAPHPPPPRQAPTPARLAPPAA
jgi:hypothetical protein